MTSGLVREYKKSMSWVIVNKKDVIRKIIQGKSVIKNAHAFIKREPNKQRLVINTTIEQRVYDTPLVNYIEFYIKRD